MLYILLSSNKKEYQSWKLSYSNILSGYQTYPVEKINIKELSDYVYQLKLETGLFFKDLKNDFKISLNNTELLPSTNILDYYHQIDKQQIVIVSQMP